MIFCSRPLVYNDDTWAFETSPDQIGCNEYLQALRSHLEGAKVLHIGIGNSSVLIQFHECFRQIDGITIMDSEIRVANGLRRLFSLEYVVHKFNKYDATYIHKLATDYDVVIDNNLKQHACCQNHWVDYFYALLERLAPNGFLLTHTQGFAPHSNRVLPLSTQELKVLCSKYSKRVFHVEPIELLVNSQHHYPVVIRGL